MYEFIPEELKRLRNWVCWKAEPDPKDVEGYETFIQRYAAGFPIERAAIETLRQQK